MTNLSIAIVLAAAIVGVSLMLSDRYIVVDASGAKHEKFSDRAWRINRLTGTVSYCYTLDGTISWCQESLSR